MGGITPGFFLLRLATAEQGRLRGNVRRLTDAQRSHLGTVNPSSRVSPSPGPTPGLNAAAAPLTSISVLKGEGPGGESFSPQ